MRKLRHRVDKNKWSKITANKRRSQKSTADVGFQSLFIRLKDGSAKAWEC